MAKETKTAIQMAASAMGKLGGKSKSKAKQRASRENGKKGGRPRKGDIAGAVFLAVCALYFAGHIIAAI